MTGVPAVKWQVPMRRVLYALAPIVAASCYYYGWRVMALLAVVTLAAYLSEYVFTRGWKQPVTSAVFVTSTLYTLSLPPALPMWMAVVGVVFAVVFGKMVFGGFGRNVFNPALTGRAFVYVSFGDAMTARWSEPIRGGWGGLAAWAPDGVTGATPGISLKQGDAIVLRDLLLGETSGTIGGTFGVLAVLCGLYIVWTKAASYRIVIAGLLGFLLVQGALWMAGVPKAADPVRAMLAGSFLIGIFFYATDPVSASQTQPGRWLYGAFVGAMSSAIGVFSAWPAGTMFAILLANMFAPIMDYAIRALQKPAAGEAVAS